MSELRRKCQRAMAFFTVRTSYQPLHPGSLIHCCGILVRPGFQNHRCHFGNVGGQRPVPDRVLCEEPEQRRVLKVIRPFESDVLSGQVWILPQVVPQCCGIAFIQQVHSPPEPRIFNALVVLAAQIVRW